MPSDLRVRLISGIPAVVRFSPRRLDIQAGLVTATAAWQRLRFQWGLSVHGSFSTSVYYGHAWGKGVIAAIYPQDANGQFVFLETNFHF